MLESDRNTGPKAIIAPDLIAVDKILPFVGRKNIIVVNKYVVKIDTKTLKVFKYFGTHCVRCGVKGTFFKLIQYVGGLAFSAQLIAIGKNCQHILMTKDHVRAVSHGGTDSIDNLQVLCQPCNEKKGATYKDYRSPKQIAKGKAIVSIKNSSATDKFRKVKNSSVKDRFKFKKAQFRIEQLEQKLKAQQHFCRMMILSRYL